MRIRSLGVLAATAVLVLAPAAPAFAADTTPPTPPGAPVASDLTEFSVVLTWAPSTDDVAVDHYEVWRAYTDIIQRVATPTAPTALITGLPRGSVSRFYVTAHDAAGNRSQASPLTTVITLPGDLEPPGPVFGLTAPEVTDTSVGLRWAGVVWGDVDTFRIYRALGSSQQFTLVGTVAWNVRTFVVTGLTPGTQYRFLVRAADAAGNESAPISPLTVTTTGVSHPDCTIDYRIISQWARLGASPAEHSGVTGKPLAEGFVAEVRIVNTGPTPVSGWSLMWTFTAGQTVTNLWSGVPVQTAGTVTVTNMPYNAVIGANGGSQTFGFLAASGGANPKPASFTLNGRFCLAA